MKDFEDTEMYKLATFRDKEEPILLGLQILHKYGMLTEKQEQMRKDFEEKRTTLQALASAELETL